MKYVCAWCGGALPGYNSDGSERVSHGICLSCVKKHYPAEYPAVKARWEMGESVRERGSADVLQQMPF